MQNKCIIHMLFLCRTSSGGLPHPNISLVPAPAPSTLMPADSSKYVRAHSVMSICHIMCLSSWAQMLPREKNSHDCLQILSFRAQLEANGCPQVQHTLVLPCRSLPAGPGPSAASGSNWPAGVGANGMQHAPALHTQSGAAGQHHGIPVMSADVGAMQHGYLAEPALGEGAVEMVRQARPLEGLGLQFNRWYTAWVALNFPLDRPTVPF